MQTSKKEDVGKAKLVPLSMHLHKTFLQDFLIFTAEQINRNIPTLRPVHSRNIYDDF